jgi:ADP-heptose:LPS heptosyltransferase
MSGPAERERSRAARAANLLAVRSREANANILLIRLKSIGDILFTLPAVHRVRAAFAEARISYLVSKEYASLLQGFGDVDTVIALDRARFRRPNPVGVIAAAVSLLRQLRRPKSSLAIDLQGYGETALLTWWSGAPQRWGTVYRSGRKWAYTRGVNRERGRHPAEGFLALLDAGGLPSAPIRNQYALPASAVEEALQFFRERGLDPQRPTLFVQPFTSSPHKDWPLERYLAAVGTWKGRGWQVLFGGGPAERAALEPVRQAGFPVSAGESLLVTAGLMKLSTLILGGDTGLLHLAVAMDKRVVMLMGSVGPGSSHPFQHPDWTVTPEQGQAVAMITAEAVNSACAQAFAEEGVRGSH